MIVQVSLHSSQVCAAYAFLPWTESRSELAVTNLSSHLFFNHGIDPMSCAALLIIGSTYNIPIFKVRPTHLSFEVWRGSSSESSKRNAVLSLESVTIAVAHVGGRLERCCAAYRLIDMVACFGGSSTHK